MASANVYHHTLNDYRLSPEPYEGEAKSHFGAAALVVALFAGVGGYFYYSEHQRSEATVPASDDANYQGPVASDEAAPAAFDSTLTPDASGVGATNSPAPTQAPALMDRTAVESKPSPVAPQPARAKQAPVAPAREAAPAPVAATAQPEVTQPASARAAPAAASDDQATSATEEAADAEEPIASAVSEEVEPPVAESAGG